MTQFARAVRGRALPEEALAPRSAQYPERVGATRKREETVAESNLLFWLWNPESEASGEGSATPRRRARAPPPPPGRRSAAEPEPRASPGRGERPPLAVPSASSRPAASGARERRRSAETGPARGSRAAPAPRNVGPLPGGGEGGSGAARRAGGPGSPRVSLSARAPRCGTSPRLLPSRRGGIPGDGPPGVAPPPGAPPAQDRQSGDRPGRWEGRPQVPGARVVSATARGRRRPARPPRARGARGGGPGSPRSSATLGFPQRRCPRRPGWDVTPPPASRGAPHGGVRGPPQPPGRRRRPGPQRAREAQPGRCLLSVRAASREGQRRGSGRPSRAGPAHERAPAARQLPDGLAGWGRRRSPARGPASCSYTCATVNSWKMPPSPPPRCQLSSLINVVHEDIEFQTTAGVMWSRAHPTPESSSLVMSLRTPIPWEKP
nr:basic proline-rich protein-like [Equus asinus]